MFGLQILDIGLGLIFIYLLLSIICTAANELIAGIFRLRARNLAAGIENLLSNKGIVDLEKKFYTHPLIKSLYGKNRKPSYIPPRTFADTLLDLIVPVTDGGNRVLNDIRTEIVNKLDDNSELKKTFLILMESAGDDIQKFKVNIETWFNNAMDRAAGWYKRKVQKIIFVLAIIITVIANADTFEIAKALSNDPALREVIVTQAEEFAKQPSVSERDPSKRLESTMDELQQLGIPLGWSDTPPDICWIQKIFGLLLTALAVSLGAPFWFDILNKVSNLRSAGAAPKEPVQEERQDK
jgi:hypothetical protein